MMERMYPFEKEESVGVRTVEVFEQQSWLIVTNHLTGPVSRDSEDSKILICRRFVSPF